MFNVGDRVISEYYGKGTVIDIESKEWGRYPIVISFDDWDWEYFDEEGYYDCDKKESDRIRLIQSKPMQIDDKDVVDNSMNDTQSSKSIINSLSTNNRKFKIKYMDIQQYINRDDLRHIKAKTITGTIENFNNQGEVVINGEYGFCIIQYRQILQMEEIGEDC